jgi:hypothetical protein
MMTKIPGLHGWHFEVDEVSAGVYRVVGTDPRGYTVSQTGQEVDDLLLKCREHAERLVGGEPGGHGPRSS